VTEGKQFVKLSDGRNVYDAVAHVFEHALDASGFAFWGAVAEPAGDRKALEALLGRVLGVNLEDGRHAAALAVFLGSRWRREGAGPSEGVVLLYLAGVERLRLPHEPAVPMPTLPLPGAAK
jgi:hypothetical protein